MAATALRRYIPDSDVLGSAASRVQGGALRVSLVPPTWLDQANFRRTVFTLRSEARDDWYRDPWNWQEYEYLQATDWAAVVARLRKPMAASSISPVTVPKENFGMRPAILLDIIDRVAYQAAVDCVSVDVIGSLGPDTYGWRLLPKRLAPGQYANNEFQWKMYRARLLGLAEQSGLGMKVDVGSFFASIDTEMLLDTLRERTDSPAADRIADLIRSWRGQYGHVGLPQRSTASSVLANAYLMSLDEQLARTLGVAPRTRVVMSQPSRHKYVRWMDDIWMFDESEELLRRTQVSIQEDLNSKRLSLNSGKTKLLAGEELIAEVRKSHNSAAEFALRNDNTGPLEELIDRLIEDQERADSSSLKFVARRMRRVKSRYRIADLLASAPRMPHGAWAFAKLFRESVPSSEMQDWVCSYAGGGWNTFQWSLGQYFYSIPARRIPGKRIRDLAVEVVSAGTSDVTVTSAAASRLAGWEADLCVDTCQSRLATEEDPHIRRVLVLAALSAGIDGRTALSHLDAHEEGYVTRKMLEHRDCAPIPLPRYLN